MYHPIFTHATNLEFTVVSSTGESETEPHCSSSSNCTFNAKSKQKCAEALCKSQGFNSGMFLESSNNFCTNNYSSRKGWVYLYDMDQIGEQTSGSLPEAMITARCSDKKGKIVWMQQLIHVRVININIWEAISIDKIMLCRIYSFRQQLYMDFYHQRWCFYLWWSSDFWYLHILQSWFKRR